uniref:Uncharacterized protein n=1 Tax=Arundo donax TaxID=35708 RepID=A0A0A9FHA6_ARUDO
MSDAAVVLVYPALERDRVATTRKLTMRRWVGMTSLTWV